MKFFVVLLIFNLLLFNLFSCGIGEDGAITSENVTNPFSESVTYFEGTTSDSLTEKPGPLHDIEKMPRSIYGGAWSTSHVQGIAIDTEREYMYFSFTTVLVKTDMQGNVVGTLTNFYGHLGDLDFNDENGKLYGSLENKSKNSFYIAIIDVDKIDKENINVNNSDIMKVVPLPQVSEDYTATVNGKQYRYGCSGIDGVAFGPAFGKDKNSASKLMVAYGIFKDESREDNDYQVILSYDLNDFLSYEKKFNPTKTETGGPLCENRYFVYTGNTNYGVQNLEYDPITNYWLMAVYPGSKTQFTNYSLFAIDGSIKPFEGEIKGQPAKEKGLLLTLADAGKENGKNGIRGWNFSDANTGMISLDDGYFYISADKSDGSKQTCNAILYKWTGNADSPFEKVE